MQMRLEVTTLAFFAFFLALVTLADGVKLNVDATRDCDCKVVSICVLAYPELYTDERSY